MNRTELDSHTNVGGDWALKSKEALVKYGLMVI